MHRLDRRQLLQTAAFGATAGALGLGFPHVARAAGVKLGAVLPFSGGLELFGEQARLGLDLAAVVRHDPVDDRQAEPRALTDRFGGEEGLEELREVLGVDLCRAAYLDGEVFRSAAGLELSAAVVDDGQRIVVDLADLGLGGLRAQHREIVGVDDDLRNGAATGRDAEPSVVDLQIGVGAFDLRPVAVAASADL